ncbi:MAG: hypothetical protein K0B05_04670 [Bacteroidales bacterium]|nr:hypothetical protein [Bacteroidales bacterium]
MKTLNLEVVKDILREFILSDEEMICVRGGNKDGDPIVMPNPPPVKI